MLKPGPTGKYHGGKPICPDDRGGVYAKFEVVSANPPLLSLDFGTTLGWVATAPKEAMYQAQEFRAKVLDAFGKLTYNVEELPIVVKAEEERGLVRSTFPCELSVIMANPEVFLAWAQRIEEACESLKDLS